MVAAEFFFDLGFSRKSFSAHMLRQLYEIIQPVMLEKFRGPEKYGRYSGMCPPLPLVKYPNLLNISTSTTSTPTK